MAIAIALVAVVVGTVLFHFLSPWWFTDLASNWSQIDATMMMTITVTGVVFVVINLFLAFTVVRFRHRKGQKAAYEPENKRLEWGLIAVTALGIVVLLAPGLFVYSNLISPPAEAITIEALGQQWRWSFRFPGPDGVLGTTDVSHVAAQNPFGLDPDNPAGQDDVLVYGNQIHLPQGHPVQVQLRSLDVLHDFYVPAFRVKMDAVPGLVTRLWFTPERAGTYEVVCAEYCGLAHHAMRGAITVEPEAAFADWLAGQTTFAQTQAPTDTTGETGDVQVARGQQLAQAQGCLACHSLDGSPGVGPSWQGLYGREEALADGGTVVADEAYLKESILQPAAKVVAGYAPAMPAYDFGDAELDDLIAYLKSL
jgi:cytochrome c oxidase subunit 2